MSKLVPGSCKTEIVTVEGKPIDAVILSEGKGPSDGVVILDKGTATYLTSNASDLKALIENLDSLLTQLTVTLTGIDGATTSPGGQAANIALITTLQTTLVAAKETLK